MIWDYLQPSQLEEGIEARESPPSLLAAVAAAGVIVDRESIDDESDAEVTQLLANKAVHFPPVQPPMVTIIYHFLSRCI